MVHVPADTMLTVLPETVQTPVVVEAKVTALPDAPPVAETLNVPAGVKVFAAITGKVMVCAALLIVMFWLT